MSNWITARTLAAQGGEAGVPAAVLGADLGQATPFVEFRVRDLVLAGAPTSITFSFWRVEGTVVELLGTRTILAADVGMQKPARFVCEESKVYVTVAFTGGAAPTVTGSVEARGLYGVSESDQDSPDAVEVTSCALPTGAATEARQTSAALTSAADVTTAVAASTALAAGECKLGVEVQLDLAAATSIRIGGSGTDATHGHVLDPGQSYFAPVTDSGVVFYYDAVGGQTLHVVRS